MSSEEIVTRSTMDIFVRFSRDRSRFSTFIFVVGGGGYTHVAISLGEDEDYYTFSRQGFCREKRNRREDPSRDSRCMRLSVDPEVYYALRRLIAEMEEHKENYKYSVIGVIVCFFLRIPFKHKNRYFCSQFVAELLRKSGTMSMRILPSMCRPRDLHKALKKHGSLVEINGESGLDPYLVAAFSKLSEKTFFISGRCINAWLISLSFMTRQVKRTCKAVKEQFT